VRTGQRRAQTGREASWAAIPIGIEPHALGAIRNLSGCPASPHRIRLSAPHTFALAASRLSLGNIGEIMHTRTMYSRPVEPCDPARRPGTCSYLWPQGASRSHIVTLECKRRTCLFNAPHWRPQNVASASQATPGLKTVSSSPASNRAPPTRRARFASSC